MVEVALSFALILHDKSGQTEELLERFARKLQAQGVCVGGLVQRSSSYANGRNRMDLVDLRTGQSFMISQNLGPDSKGCCLDPQALVGASHVLRQAIADKVDLLVANKFSGMEAEGEGLAPDMFEAAAQGIPVLTTLASRYRDKWQALTEGLGTLLPPDEAALDQWWERVAP